jgi:hypothetical protein
MDHRLGWMPRTCSRILAAELKYLDPRLASVVSVESSTPQVKFTLSAAGFVACLCVTAFRTRDASGWLSERVRSQHAGLAVLAESVRSSTHLPGFIGTNSHHHSTMVASSQSPSTR